MKAKLVIFGLAICLVAAPVKADLFGFSISNPVTTWDGASLFQVLDQATTVGHLYRNSAPVGDAVFSSPSWGTGFEAFLISMTISNLTANTADGAGTFSFTDVDGDIVAGNVSGNWTKVGNAGVFFGSLSNVTYTSAVDNAFDGHSGSASMVFASPQPWNGTLLQVTAGGTWFTGQSYRIGGGSIDATVVPVPAALLLGLLGLGAAGIRLRRFA